MLTFCKWVIISIVFYIVIITVILFNTAHKAHAGPHATWFKNQYNAYGQNCCDEADGHPYYGGYTINADGSVTLQLKDGPLTVEPKKVLKGANPTGHAVWWYLGGPMGTYCFALGPLM